MAQQKIVLYSSNCEKELVGGEQLEYRESSVSSEFRMPETSCFPRLHCTVLEIFGLFRQPAALLSCVSVAGWATPLLGDAKHSFMQ